MASWKIVKRTETFWWNTDDHEPLCDQVKIWGSGTCTSTCCHRVCHQECWWHTWGSCLGIHALECGQAPNGKSQGSEGVFQCAHSVHSGNVCFASLERQQRGFSPAEGRLPVRESLFQQMPNDQRQQPPLEVQCLFQKIIPQRRNLRWGGSHHWWSQHFTHEHQDIVSEGCRLRLQRGLGRGSVSCGREGD